MIEDDLEAVEWHDGKLESVFASAASVVLRFRECFVYRLRAAERYDVEAGASTLTAVDVVEFEIQGTIGAEASVSSCDILSAGEAVSLRALLRGTGEGNLSLLLTSGTWIRVRFGNARIEFEPPFTFSHTWDGPLISPG